MAAPSHEQSTVQSVEFRLDFKHVFKSTLKTVSRYKHFDFLNGMLIRIWHSKILYGTFKHDLETEGLLKHY